jgi:nicotinamidase-related amidase
MSRKVSLVCIDLQNDFSSEGGACYLPKPSVGFILEVLCPILEKVSLGVSEIVSDYRQPRPGDERDCCRPGEWGYISLLPDAIRKGRPWVKSMNSPVWIRDGIGDPEAVPGEPYPDPKRFGDWLIEQIGDRDEAGKVIMFGLTADCCVLAAVQELKWRGYDVKVLSEATDVRSGDQKEKEDFLSSPPFTFWGSRVGWEELKEILRS